MAGLELRRVGIEFVDAAPFGERELLIGHGLHLFMQPAIERPVGGNQNELGAETCGFACRHGRMNAERTGRITRCRDDASRRGSTHGHRFTCKAWVCQDGCRGEHRIDVPEEDLARPAHHRTSSQVTGHSVNRFEVT